jgi:hypothetical protein
VRAHLGQRCLYESGGLRSRARTLGSPNHRLQPTPYSLRSAPTSGCSGGERKHKHEKVGVYGHKFALDHLLGERSRLLAKRSDGLAWMLGLGDIPALRAVLVILLESFGNIGLRVGLYESAAFASCLEGVFA